MKRWTICYQRWWCSLGRAGLLLNLSSFGAKDKDSKLTYDNDGQTRMYSFSAGNVSINMRFHALFSLHTKDLNDLKPLSKLVCQVLFNFLPMPLNCASVLMFNIRYLFCKYLRQFVVVLKMHGFGFLRNGKSLYAFTIKGWMIHEHVSNFPWGDDLKHTKGLCASL